MNQLLFLGTGPAGGTKRGQSGRSKRLESSALIKTGTHTILIDVTSHFALQSKHIDSIDAILITHGHLDAIGGIGQLRDWQRRQHKTNIPLYTFSETIEIIKKRFPTDHLDFHPLIPYQPLSLFHFTITPLPVTHSLQAGFPTLGFSFAENGESLLAYASDTSGWNKKTEEFLKLAQTLIIDGAMWHMRMPAHLEIPKILPILCTWSNKRIIFTQSAILHHHLKFSQKKLKPCAQKPSQPTTTCAFTFDNGILSACRLSIYQYLLVIILPSIPAIRR